MTKHTQSQIATYNGKNDKMMDIIAAPMPDLTSVLTERIKECTSVHIVKIKDFTSVPISKPLLQLMHIVETQFIIQDAIVSKASQEIIP